MRVVFFVCLLGVLSGCWSHEAARPRSGLPENHEMIADSAWPVRDVTVLASIMEKTPDQVHLFKVRDGVDPATLNGSEQALVQPSATVVYKAVHGRNLLRLYQEAEKPKEHADGIDIGYLFMGFRPNGFLISSRTVSKDKERKEQDAKLRPQQAPIRSFAPTDLTKVKVEALDLSELYLESGLPVRIPDAAPNPVKGLIVHLQSLGANDYEPQVLAEFQRRGWAVIDVKPQSFIASPVPEAWYPEIKALRAEYQKLSLEVYDLDPELRPAVVPKQPKEHPKYHRFIEVEKRLAKLLRGGFQVCSDEDKANVASEIAREIDQGMAGAAYAVESVLDYVDTQRPDLQGVPTVLMGFSAGALATPTAAARMESVKPGRLDAVVLIAGGCNLLRIARESAFNDGGLKLLCSEEPVSKQVQSQLFDLYLAASKLDPYHTAPLIAHLPVLQVHASKDTWVPAATGELLYHRLNCPERLILSADHDMLFYLITQKQKWIADWVERVVHPAVSQSAKAALNRAVR